MPMHSNRRDLPLGAGARAATALLPGNTLAAGMAAAMATGEIAARGLLDRV